MTENISITFVNWDKYQIRNDCKKNSWFRLQNDIFIDPKLFDFSIEEIGVFVFLLCTASIANKRGTLTVNNEYAHRVARIEKNLLHRTIKKLKQNQIVEVRTLRGRYVNYTRTSQHITEHNSTLHNITEHNITEYIPSEPKDSHGEKNKNFDDDILEKNAKTAFKKICIQTWESYKNQYQKRYSTVPIRNATINSQISNFVKRIGTDSPELVKFYLECEDNFYKTKYHQFGLCLQNAEALHTRWKTNSKNIDLKSKNQNVTNYNQAMYEAIKKGEL